MAWKDIKETVNEWYHMTIAPEIKSVASYSYAKEIAVAVAIVLVVVAGFWGYRSYRSSQEASAQIALAQAIQSYQEAVQGGSIGLAQLEMILQANYEQHKQSRLAPYFLAYKAEVQVKQDKLADACVTMKNVIADLPKKSPLMNLYKTKLALMSMDLPDSAEQQAAVAALRELGYDKENRFNDYALYYLGLFTWNQGNKEDAQKIWTALVESQRHEQRLAQSPWVALAKEKLAQSGELKTQE